MTCDMQHVVHDVLKIQRKMITDNMEGAAQH